VSAVRLLRCCIAVIASAVSGHLVFKVTTVVVRAAFTPLAGPPETWADSLDKLLLLGALLISARVAYGIARRLWPERTYQELEKARQTGEAKRALAPKPAVAAKRAVAD